MPSGHDKYFWVVTREIVDSCIFTLSAISRSTRGRMPTAPIEKKVCWRATISWATFRMVSSRCAIFFTIQLASNIFCFNAPSAFFPPFSLRILAYSVFREMRGLALGLDSTTHFPRFALTTTSGKTHWSCSRSNWPPGLCCKLRMHSTAFITSACDLPQACFILSQSLEPTWFKCVFTMRFASPHSSALFFPSWRMRSICSERHSARLRAPTPGGSSACSVIKPDSMRSIALRALPINWALISLWMDSRSSIK